MSDAIFNAATVGGQLFGIQSFSGIINYYSSNKIIKTEYYICINKAVAASAPDATQPNNWKLIGEVQVQYSGNNVEKIWRSR
jgi:hypothetical protein